MKYFSEVTACLKKVLKRACSEIAIALYKSSGVDRSHVFLFIDRTPTNKKIKMSPADWRNVVYMAYRDCKVSPSFFALFRFLSIVLVYFNIIFILLFFYIY